MSTSVDSPRRRSALAALAGGALRAGHRRVAAQGADEILNYTGPIASRS